MTNQPETSNATLAMPTSLATLHITASMVLLAIVGYAGIACLQLVMEPIP